VVDGGDLVVYGVEDDGEYKSWWFCCDCCALFRGKLKMNLMVRHFNFRLETSEHSCHNLWRFVCLEKFFVLRFKDLMGMFGGFCGEVRVKIDLTFDKTLSRIFD
jgi:hypothetical protein